MTLPLWASIAVDAQTIYVAVLIGLLVPLGSLRTARRFAAAPATGRQPFRLRQGGLQALLLALTLFVARTHGLALFFPPPDWPRAITFAAAALVLVVLCQRLSWILRSEEARRTMWVRHILPRTSPELAAWMAVSILTGVAEEAMYRGLLFAIILSASGSVWAAALGTGVAFTLAHLPQGGRTLVAIAAIAAVLQVLVLATASLVPAMAVHALANTIAGLSARRRLEAA